MRHWEILAFLKSEDAINIYYIINISMSAIVPSLPSDFGFRCHFRRRSFFRIMKPGSRNYGKSSYSYESFSRNYEILVANFFLFTKCNALPYKLNYPHMEFFFPATLAGK